MQRVAAGNDGKTFGIKNQSAICAEFQVDVFGNSGLMTVAIPEAALLPFRRKLERDDTEAVPQLDLVWHDRLMAQIASADVQMDAVIDGPRLSIGEVSTLRVNQMLKLPALTEALLSFESMDCALFQCRLGQSDGTFTVQVERCVGRPDGY
jgi:flagellar motor switch protein FliM